MPASTAPFMVEPIMVGKREVWDWGYQIISCENMFSYLMSLFCIFSILANLWQGLLHNLDNSGRLSGKLSPHPIILRGSCKHIRQFFVLLIVFFCVICSCMFLSRGCTVFVFQQGLFTICSNISHFISLPQQHSQNETNEVGKVGNLDFYKLW